MKSILLNIATLGAALVVAANAAEDKALPPGRIDFGKFSPSASGQFVDINLNSAMISFASRLAGKGDPEAGKLLASLNSIRVNVVGIDDHNSAEVKDRMNFIRKQLDNAGWERIVTVQEKKDDVEIYTKMQTDEVVEGIVITVMSGKKEAVFINVVGDIRPEQLAGVAEQLNIAQLKRVAGAVGGHRKPVQPPH